MTNVNSTNLPEIFSLLGHYFLEHDFHLNHIMHLVACFSQKRDNLTVFLGGGGACIAFFTTMENI